MKKIHLLILLFISLFINACAKTQESHSNIQQTLPPVSAKEASRLTPEQIVILYFQAWSTKQYDVMYSLISDGFKQIEPTAKTFNDFKFYIEKFYDTSSGIDIVYAKEAYQTEKEAGVNYKIEIARKDGSKREFESAYTLKKRANGWKLIHPYGENIDKS